MLVNLKTTREAQVARAKADIDAAIVAFQTSLEDFSAGRSFRGRGS